MNTFDLVIVGGGLVGAGMAASLRDADLRIAVVDARMPMNDDPRLFALNFGSGEFLKHIGIWPKVAPHASPIHQVHVSNQGRFGSVRLNRGELNLPTLGHVVPAREIEYALSEALASQANVTLFQPAKLIKLTQQEGVATLVLETTTGEKVVSTSLVIGADGTQSTVRTQLGIDTAIYDYQQSALVTRTTLTRTHDQIAYERFYPQGAIAMLPLPNQECATIWTADTESVTALMALSETEFLKKLQKEFGYRLGRLKTISQRHVFPLRMVRAEKALDQCVYLLGNSAHTLHPIAAQGFNLALFEVAVLVEAIFDGLAKGKTLSVLDLSSIHKRIEEQLGATIAVSHRLPQLFNEKDSSLFRIVLPLGMVGFNLATPVKKRFIKRILGRTGQVPRLLMSANNDHTVIPP